METRTVKTEKKKQQGVQIVSTTISIRVQDLRSERSCDLLLWQQPHARRAQDVERGLFVFVLWDVSGGEAQQRIEVVAGLRGRLRQGGDT